MTDAEWLLGIADSGWNNDEWSPEVKAMLRRVAGELDEIDRLRAELAAAKAQSPRPALSLSRDDLGRIARQAWFDACYGALPSTPFAPWEESSEFTREMNRKIADAVVAAVEPPRPAAMLWSDSTAWDAYERYEDADAERDRRREEGRQPPLMIVKSWHWHPKGA